MLLSNVWIYTYMSFSVKISQLLLWLVVLATAIHLRVVMTNGSLTVVSLLLHPSFGTISHSVRMDTCESVYITIYVSGWIHVNLCRYITICVSGWTHVNLCMYITLYFVFKTHFWKCNGFRLNVIRGVKIKFKVYLYY